MNREKEIKSIVKIFYYNGYTPETIETGSNEWLDCESFRKELGYSTIEEMFNVIIAKHKLRLATYENLNSKY